MYVQMDLALIARDSSWIVYQVKRQWKSYSIYVCIFLCNKHCVWNLFATWIWFLQTTCLIWTDLCRLVRIIDVLLCIYDVSNPRLFYFCVSGQAETSEIRAQRDVRRESVSQVSLRVLSFVSSCCDITKKLRPRDKERIRRML